MKPETIEDVKLKISGINKLSTEDRYEEGEVGKTSDHLIEIDLTGQHAEPVKAQNILINKFLNFCGHDLTASYEYGHDMDEPNRVDTHVMENKNGEQATTEQLELWKKGQYRLWSCTYTAYVDRIIDYALVAS